MSPAGRQASRRQFGQVVELADTYGSGPYAERLEGSSPSLPTQIFKY